MSPTKGPKKAFSQFQIHGIGLWEASTILVKFTSHVHSIYNPPRSVMGKVAGNVITCKPPKFAEVGYYKVEISMDGGTEFLPDTFDIFIYKEATVTAQSPAIIDLRQSRIDSLNIVSNIQMSNLLVVF